VFDNYVFIENSCKNVAKGEKIIGFEAQTLITYYRGIPLSMVYDIGLEVDGLPVPREALRISLNGEDWFTPAEAETVTSCKWEYGEPLTVRALVDGGLRKGEHDVRMNVSVWPAYYPVPAGGERVRKVVIS
jgi:hypothetical protein